MHETGPIRTLLLLIAMTLLAGCAGSRGEGITDTSPELPTPSREDLLAVLAESEDFDAAPYSDEPPPESFDVSHRVPDELMEGRADAGVVGRQRGYRINLVLARDKETADTSVEDFLAWWGTMKLENPDSPLYRDEPPVYTTYRQPYYRVRIGDYASEQIADNLLSQIKSAFPRAFVVIDVINFQR